MRSILHWLPCIALSLLLHLVALAAVAVLYGTLAAPITIEVPVTVEVQLAQQTTQAAAERQQSEAVYTTIAPRR